MHARVRCGEDAVKRLRGHAHQLTQALVGQVPLQPQPIQRHQFGNHEDNIGLPLYDVNKKTRNILDDVKTPRSVTSDAVDRPWLVQILAALAWTQDHGTHLTVLRPKGQKTTYYKVPVSARLRVALDALPQPHTGPVFPSVQVPRPDRRRLLVEEMFARRCRAVDIPFGRAVGGLTFHALRHTGASRMLNRGVDLKTVAEIGNWKNLAVLQRYLHPLGEARQAAVDAVGSGLAVTPR